MATVPISSLTPTNSPPFDKSIRGIVTLSWPYSSSTRQCALLLADPDFRLRNRKGQVRIRFAGASAEAIAKARLGIGDELVLSLNGASWEEDPEATRTPGKSVDGELFFRRKLELKILKGGEGDIEINVDAPASPLRRSSDTIEEHATPLPKAVSNLRSSLDGAVDALPSYTYTSPAFVKRLRLSGESFLDSAFDPFVGDHVEVEEREENRKSLFGSNLRWRYAETTPSPTKNRAGPDEVSLVTRKTPDRTDERVGGEKMLPPPVPRLQVPPSTPPEKGRAAERDKRPVTPKLQAVPSPTLPLPSPFPTETTQSQFGLLGLTSVALSQRQGSASGEDGRHDEQEQERTQETTTEPVKSSTQLQEVHEPVSTEAPQMPGQFDESPVEGLTMQQDEDEDEDMLDVLNTTVDEAQAGNAIEFEGVTIHDEAERNYELPKPMDQVVEPIELPKKGEEPIARTGHSMLSLSASYISKQPETPTKTTAQLTHSDFGLDGTTSTGLSAQVTPQPSEKDKIMAQTYQSLFGFKSSPVSSPPRSAQEQQNSPTPEQGYSDMAKARLEAAGVAIEDSPKPPFDETIAGQPGETKGDASAETSSTTAWTSHKLPLETPLFQPERLQATPGPTVEVVDEDEFSTPKPMGSTGHDQRFRSPEIQDSLEDSEPEDLLNPRQHASLEIIEQPRLAQEHDILPAPQIIAETDLQVEGTLPSTFAKIPSAALPAEEEEEIHEEAALQQSVSEATVIDLVSSPTEPTDSSPLDGRKTDKDVFVEFIGEDELEGPGVESFVDVESHVEVKTQTPGIEETNERPSIPNETSDLTIQLQTTTSISYPSLPLSPSDSQSLQEMSSQMEVRSAIPETLQSMLPSTPQLTQVDSFTQTQKQPGEEPPASQETGIDEATRPPKPPIEEAEPPWLAQVESAPTVEEPVKVAEAKKTPARKSFGARISNVPDVISAWFSPRRSSGVVDGDIEPKQAVDERERIDADPERPEMQQIDRIADNLVNGTSLSRGKPIEVNKIQTNGLSTALSYFTGLSRLDELLNPSRQQQFGTHLVDVFAVVTHDTKEPVCAKAGPRDYFTIFRISDAGLPAQSSVRVEVFRPWMATLPVAQAGDVVLLRQFTVKSRKRQAYLLSTDASAWCVWRYRDAGNGLDSKKPIWARKAGSGDEKGVREEMKGPPVELGEEEREHARRLRLWWELLRSEVKTNDGHDMGDDATMNGHVSSQTITAKL